ncbi:Opacity protein [Muriicola jejuensis]|uniref:Outer membrane beta-barrel protein n=1 Tax=Muriicola jejuensis TaxID=504488 RepID=A0A6P0U9L0_9FLAO|nr:outer membrane beta-barrel protein [Muriicola jejuensis]NER09864.1 outer membrane beta-barrel protein [Muriicola jejuensis]SMP05137.1 Opacity protein [Muriicola jejuensis]
MKKKDIEKVFQEKLKDHSEIPEEQVWERISASLDNKKNKRRIIPIWWRIAGVAALLLAGLFLFLPSGNQTTSEEPVTKTTTESPVVQEPGNVVPEKMEEESNSILASEENSVKGKEPENQENDAPTIANEETLRNSLPSKESEFAKNDVPVTPEHPLTEDPLQKYANKSDISDIAQLTPTVKQNAQMDSQAPAPTEDILARNSKKEPAEDESNAIQLTESNKPPILDAIAAQEEELSEETSAKRWEVGPRVAPVYFSSLAQGSPIHSSFRDNAKSGNVNMSYGVAVTYELGKRLKVRSGVHRVDFGYDTQDVSFSSSLNANTNGIINNINYNLSSRNLVVRSNTNSGKVDLENAQDVAGPDPSLNGKMVQEFGYLEVPLELTYEILDRKVGVNLVGGVSSLFLTNNTVVLEANGNTTEMGEANNINDLNFSTNFGVGFSYQINDRIKLNLEPMFKYQLNTFSDTSGNFQPFSMGIYSGLNFRF